ncbi:hypothetical protein GCM10010411_52870 [Actinomadura fulvescens]|uniref:Uncharacterized protein n=1 Tax=Actinomadura fulvescens TaxID=46160 RepID=A0ABP6CBB7_9ACTN
MEFRLDGRRVSLAALESGSSEFQVLVDGVPVPMDVARTATYTGNVGTHTREVEPRHPAPSIRIEGDPQEPDIRGSRTVSIYFQQPTGYVYNTSVWRSESVRLTFASDFSRVAIDCDQAIDTST